MKTYLFDTINRYKRFSETLDIQTKINNKSWWVFNDNGQKELYIFQPNNQCYVTSNGIGIQGNWEYITANKSLIINVNKSVLMLHPVFMDDNLLTLNLDGTNQYSFLIEEENNENFAPKTLSQLMNYFENKERLAQEADRKRIDEERKIAKEKFEKWLFKEAQNEEIARRFLRIFLLLILFVIFICADYFISKYSTTGLYKYINLVILVGFSIFILNPLDKKKCSNLDVLRIIIIFCVGLVALLFIYVYLGMITLPTRLIGLLAHSF
jgi:hypothetical protein